MLESDIESTQVHQGAMHWLLFAYTFVLAVNVGGALLATAVIFPVWSASPATAKAWTGVVNEAPFFVVVSPIVLLLAIATLIMSGRAPKQRRAWIRVSTGLYLVFFVATLTYFVPGQAALHGTTGVQLAKGGGPQPVIRTACLVT